jgi:hypothetical protein
MRFDVYIHKNSVCRRGKNIQSKSFVGLRAPRPRQGASPLHPFISRAIARFNEKFCSNFFKSLLGCGASSPTNFISKSNGKKSLPFDLKK